MKIIKAVAWGIIATTSFIGAVELANRVQSVNRGDCSEIITTTEFSKWSMEHGPDLNYENGTWYNAQGDIIGTADSEDTDICAN